MFSCGCPPKEFHCNPELIEFNPILLQHPIGVHGLTPQVLYSYMDLDPSDTPPKYAAAGQRYWTHLSSIGLSYVSYLRWGLFLAFPPSRRHTGPAWNLLLPMFDLLISYSPQSRYMLSNSGFFIKPSLQFEVKRE